MVHLYISIYIYFFIQRGPERFQETKGTFDIILTVAEIVYDQVLTFLGAELIYDTLCPKACLSATHTFRAT